MKKSLLVVLILGVAAVSSAATVGVMKYMASAGKGGAIIIVSDKRCAECNTQGLQSSLTKTFPEAKFETVDYSDAKGKKLFESEKLTMLPAVLLPKGMDKTEGFKKVERFAKLSTNYYALMSGGKFDPKAEICDNTTDDNGDKLVDCADPTCTSNWKCMEKKDKPTVDVFVMSHCPYGTQIEKGLLPVWDLMGDKIDLNIRFCDYAMHGEKEVKEQLRQFCIQEQGKPLYRTYLECFLKDGVEGDKCVKEAKVDEKALAACVEKTDKEFGVIKALTDKEGWKGRFPPFAVNAEMAKKYGVQGSPTLVINGVVAKTGRNPKALLEAVCQGFKEQPAECKKDVTADNPTPGFGVGKTAPTPPGGKAPDAGCGA